MLKQCKEKEKKRKEGREILEIFFTMSLMFDDHIISRLRLDWNGGRREENAETAKELLYFYTVATIYQPSKGQDRVSISCLLQGCRRL